MSEKPTEIEWEERHSCLYDGWHWVTEDLLVTVLRRRGQKTWGGEVSMSRGCSYVEAGFYRRKNPRNASLAALNFLKRIGWKPLGGKPKGVENEK